MSICYYDTILCNAWNKATVDMLQQENFWEICRILEDKGYLLKNQTAVTTFAIGPFRIATNISIEKKDLLMFFAEVIIPVLLQDSQITSGADKWQFVLLPLVHICVNLLDKTFLIKDIDVWKILLYIKNRNHVGRSPSLCEIKTLFPEEEGKQVEKMMKELLSYPNFLGASDALIEIVSDGGYKSLV